MCSCTPKISLITSTTGALALPAGRGAVGGHLEVADRDGHLAGHQAVAVGLDLRLRHHRQHGGGKAAADEVRTKPRRRSRTGGSRLSISCWITWAPGQGGRRRGL
jgi:hypothetical protein